MSKVKTTSVGNCTFGNPVGHTGREILVERKEDTINFYTQ